MIPQTSSGFEPYLIKVAPETCLWNYIICLRFYYTPIKTNVTYVYATRVTWRVPLVEQELLTLPEHLSSHLVFYEGTCFWIFSFLFNALYIIVYPFVRFLWANVLSIRLWFTDSDYPFGIFNFLLVETRTT